MGLLIDIAFLERDAVLRPLSLMTFLAVWFFTQDKGARIIIGNFFGKGARKVFCEVRVLKSLALPSLHSNHLGKKSKLPTFNSDLPKITSARLLCRKTQMFSWVCERSLHSGLQTKDVRAQVCLDSLGLHREGMVELGGLERGVFPRRNVWSHGWTFGHRSFVPHR